LREYVWLDGLAIAVVADVDTMSPNLYFVHADHLNRPLKMTDGSQAIVWDAIYRPFGEVHSISGAASNNLRFPGQYFLIEDGLHYNWHRHYDPTLGRYLQADLDYDFTRGKGKGSRSDSHSHCRNQCHAHLGCPDQTASCTPLPSSGPYSPWRGVSQ
jgi:RHS repeat-associated protein